MITDTVKPRMTLSELKAAREENWDRYFRMWNRLKYEARPDHVETLKNSMRVVAAKASYFGAEIDTMLGINGMNHKAVEVLTNRKSQLQ